MTRGAQEEKRGMEQKGAQQERGMQKNQKGAQEEKRGMDQKGAQQERGMQKNDKGAQEEKRGMDQKGAQEQREQRGTNKGGQEERGAQQQPGTTERGTTGQTGQVGVTGGARGSSVQLSEDQRSQIKTIVGRGNAPRFSGNVDFDVRVGTKVPRSVHFVALPEDIVRIVPEYRGYDYVLVRDEILIIDPGTLEIVAVIPA